MEWISVKDRLPWDSTRVLVCCKSRENKGHAISLVWFHVWSNSFSFSNEVRIDMEVTHWMELPGTPKEADMYIYGSDSVGDVFKCALCEECMTGTRVAFKMNVFCDTCYETRVCPEVEKMFKRLFRKRLKIAGIENGKESVIMENKDVPPSLSH